MTTWTDEIEEEWLEWYRLTPWPDRQYWLPLRRELETLRHSQRVMAKNQ
jgi:phage baseplate assembly protein gpV